MPEQIPKTENRAKDWRHLSFPELAVEICRLYATDIPDPKLFDLVSDSFLSFDSPEVVPLRNCGKFHVLELFHGPTLAFKDVALQVLGRLFDLILDQDDSRLNILGATSGDTGSAAIAAVQGSSRINIFVLYPDGRTSPLQELQMTTNESRNVHCLALNGSFDDCQGIMKSIFSDSSFKTRFQLGSINSVNWARVMVQIVYYYFAALKFEDGVTFSVPTGNFGNILAGIIAKRMGAPIKRFILGTNENDILSRFFNSGVYQQGQVHQTLSPSMDIQVASNLERYLFLRTDFNPDSVSRFMERFARDGRAMLNSSGICDRDISARAISTQESLQTIRKVWEQSSYVVDPHTAVGIAAAIKEGSDSPVVCLATAHPAKFPDAVERGIGKPPPSHPTLEALEGKRARKTVLPASELAVREYLEKELSDP